MIGTPVPRVDIGDLGIAGELGAGGQGKVRAVSSLLINGRWPTAVKIYSPAAAQNANTVVLERIAKFPQQLNLKDSAWLQERTAWPSVIVEDRGALCGFLMRMVPDAYYFNFQTQTLGTRRHLADMAFLLNSDRYISSSGLAVSDRDRLGLLASIAGTLSRLHVFGVTVGDLSPKNLLFSLAPPNCFIIDCDAMRVRGESVLEQVETPDWEVPNREEKATPVSDAYKFGLLAIRLFARDQSSYDRNPLAVLSPELGRLAAKSLRSKPSGRPRLDEWLPALQAAGIAANAAAAPVTRSSSRTYVPRPPVLPVPQRPVRQTPARRSRRIGAALGGVAAIAAAAVVTAVGLHATSSPGSISGTSTTGGGSSASQQATQINGLLDSSAASRRSLISAVKDVHNCANLSSAVSAISAVAHQRSNEYSRASDLPTTALPNGPTLKSDLLSALGFSVDADKDFLTWAREQLNSGCGDTVSGERAYSSGAVASDHAVTAKPEFLELWNPVASSQGLPSRSQQGI